MNRVNGPVTDTRAARKLEKEEDLKIHLNKNLMASKWRRIQRYLLNEVNIIWK